MWTFVGLSFGGRKRGNRGGVLLVDFLSVCPWFRCLGFAVGGRLGYGSIIIPYRLSVFDVSPVGFGLCAVVLS